jgi:hypothetical protein
MKKRFIINLLVVGTLCLIVFSIVQKSEVKFFKEKNSQLKNQNEVLEEENRKLKESLQRLNTSDSNSFR